MWLSLAPRVSRADVSRIARRAVALVQSDAPRLGDHVQYVQDVAPFCVPLSWLAVSLRAMREFAVLGSRVSCPGLRFEKLKSQPFTVQSELCPACVPRHASTEHTSTRSNTPAPRGGMLASLRRLSAAVLGPWSISAWRRPPPTSMMPLLVDSSSAARVASPMPSSLSSLLLDGLLRMAVPKKRTSYTRKRVRQAGQQIARGPQRQNHMYMCPVCERFRLPHRVCGREDCQTYFKRALTRWPRTQAAFCALGIPVAQLTGSPAPSSQIDGFRIDATLLPVLHITRLVSSFSRARDGADLRSGCGSCGTISTA